MKQFIAGLTLGILVTGVAHADITYPPSNLLPTINGGGCQPPNVIREFVDWTGSRTVFAVNRMPVLVCPSEGVCSYAPEAPPKPAPTFLCLTPEQNEEAIRRGGP